MKTSNVIVTYKFTRLRLVLLIAFIREGILKMAGSAVYPNPSPSLAEGTAVADAAEDAMDEAADGDRVKIAFRNVRGEELIEYGRNLASYVQGHCQNSVANVLAAGFEVRKTNSKVGIPGVPLLKPLEYTGMTGEFLMRLGPVKGKLNYTIQMAESMDGPFTTILTSSSGRVVLKGFTPGKKYYLRACANGTAGPGPLLCANLRDGCLRSKRPHSYEPWKRETSSTVFVFDGEPNGGAAQMSRISSAFSRSWSQR